MCEPCHEQGYPKPLHPREKRRAPRWMRRIWRGVREWCGDAAYEKYLRSGRHSSRTDVLLSAEEFYVQQLERRYSRPNRCC